MSNCRNYILPLGKWTLNPCSFNCEKDVAFYNSKRYFCSIKAIQIFFTLLNDSMSFLTCQLSRIFRESHGFWPYIPAKFVCIKDKKAGHSAKSHGFQYLNVDRSTPRSLTLSSFINLINEDRVRLLAKNRDF